MALQPTIVMPDFADRVAKLAPPTPDDQCRTWDGRVLDTKEKVLEFLAEYDQAVAEGRTIGPPLD